MAAQTPGVQGESLSHIYFGISYLSNHGAYDLGQKVAVTGMGNVAMDVSRTAARLQNQGSCRVRSKNSKSHDRLYGRIQQDESCHCD